jgi:hypothetical protein
MDNKAISQWSARDRAWLMIFMISCALHDPIEGFFLWLG